MVNRDDSIEVNQVEARQGTSAPRLRYVLIGGLALALIAFVVLMTIHF